MTRKHYFYQIDYINNKNEATYIKTFTNKERAKAIKEVDILNKANMCLNDDTYFVLDKYESYDYDGETDVIIEENITKADSIKGICSKARKELDKGNKQ